MPEEQHRNDNDADDPECKIFVSRIPDSFSEESVERLLQEQLGEGAVLEVALAYPKEGEEDQQQQQQQQQQQKHRSNSNQPDDAASARKHRGFGFVRVDTAERAQKAFALKTVRGGAKASSKRMHVLYLRPVAPVDKDDDGNVVVNEEQTPGGGGMDSACYLWESNRCPYGDACKFAHVGEGGCLDQSKSGKKKKCFAFKKGKCKAGDDCPYSHDFVVSTPAKSESTDDGTEVKSTSATIPKNEKVCINWKTKGKCRKGDQCPYQHDESVREAGQAKRAAKKGTTSKVNAASSLLSKVRQPLWVRAFGLNYDSTQEDIRSHFKDCGPIMEVNFPTFEDSGRSKGYCGVRFQSPNAVEKAIDLNGKELHGRWLSVQAGKMYLRQWEEQVQAQEQAQAKSRKVPDGQTEELDQRDVKRRKGA
jgi:RNA recognition motif-containing protein